MPDLPQKPKEHAPSVAALFALPDFWRGRAKVREASAFEMQTGEAANDAQLRHHRIAQEHYETADGLAQPKPLLRLVHRKGGA